MIPNTMFKHELEGNAAASAIEALERAELFAESPTCFKCKEPIASVEEALLISRADGTMCLTHFSAECFSREIEAMLLRYLAAPRVRWTSRAAS